MNTQRDLFVSRLVDYAAQADDPPEFVIPEDLASLDDAALAALQEQAVGVFDGLFGDGTGLSADDLAALAGLTEGIEALNAEAATRGTAAQERADAAQALAARIRPTDQSAAATVTDEDGNDLPATDDEGYLIDDAGNRVTGDDGNPVLAENADPAEAAAAGTVVASGRREIRVPARSRRTVNRPAVASTGMADLVSIGDVPGFQAGAGAGWGDLGRATDKRLGSYNAAQYAAAARSGRSIKERLSVGTFRKPIPADLILRSSDPEHVQQVFDRAMDQSRLPQQSLVASGGWCAPSETLYTMCELESNDGLLSVPEVGISRGGISWTTGPAWADLYAAGIGFHYTEQNDIDGTYAVDANGNGTGAAGDKPCYKVECPPFEEARLDTDGLCIQAGLLQSKGYPEVIARTLRGVMVAHNHHISARTVAAMVAGSTAVTMTAGQVGATAPLLDAIELQVEHYRYVHRLSRNATLEAVFPYWVHGVVRSDLARRLGLAEFDVPDSRIDQWFRSRGIAPQFVYDWQPIGGAATAFKAWPATVQFLLYAAGTWVKGTADVISLDTLYDSTLLAQNDYTALFTEEGSLMAKMCDDSRVITVALCPDGGTHGGVDIACDGTAAVTP